MKTRHFSIIAVTVLLLVSMMMNNPVKAECLGNPDWPDAPCWGCPGCAPDKEKQREEWAPYYQYKGASWMEMMKTQMIESMKNGTLQDWVNGNQSNYNAWEYYYLNNQAPFFRSSVSGLNDEPHYIPPPLQQLKTGIDPKDVVCKQGLQLIFKIKDNFPACVKQQTASKLAEHGWGTPVPAVTEQNIPIPSSSIMVTNTNFTINYNISGNNKLIDANMDLQSKSLILSLNTTNNGTLTVSIPRALLDIKKNDRGMGEFYMLADGQETTFKEINTTSTDRIFLIPFQNGTKDVEIIATELI